MNKHDVDLELSLVKAGTSSDERARTKNNLGSNSIVDPPMIKTHQDGDDQPRGDVSFVSRNQIDARLKRRPFDLVIFGASGSVGAFIVEEMALVVKKFYPAKSQPVEASDRISPTFLRRDPNQFAQNRRRSVPQQIDEIRWAVAGRSAMRLSETLNRAELSTGIRDLSGQVSVLLADLNHYKSLLDMCQKTALVMNCVGPYSTDGESLIRACIETKTNYMDLCHETSFIELIRQLYSQKATNEGVYIINGCGFQSMSVEMGLNFTKQMVDGQIEDVKIVLSLSDTSASGRKSQKASGWLQRRGIVSSGMWASFLAERSNHLTTNNALSSNRSTSHRSTEPIGEEDEQADESSPEGRGTKPQSRLIRRDTELLVHDMVEYKNRDSLAWLQLTKSIDDSLGKSYCFPINNITSEESQLTRGEMATYKLQQPDLDSSQAWRPVRCTSFVSLKSLGQVIVFCIWLVIFNILVKLAPIRYLMRAFPSVPSLGNVGARGRPLERDSVSHIKFSQTFVVYGTPGDYSGDPLDERKPKSKRRPRQQLLVSRVVGPEPNHVATASFAVQAALTIIAERDHLPRKGGVMTPGAAFTETNIIHQLRKRNIKFEVLKKT